MRRLIFLALLLFALSLPAAAQCGHMTVNGTTGKLDCTGVGLPASNGTWCVQVSSGVSTWTSCPGAGGGISSIGLTLPSWYTATPNPLTVNGAITISPATGQTPHRVLGTCGTATSISLCALVAGDIPALPYQGTITTGTTLQYFRGDLSLATFPTTWAWANLTGVPSTFPPVNSGDWAGTWQTHPAAYFQQALANYSTIAALTGYPSSFPPTNSGDWAGTWQTYSPAYFQAALSITTTGTSGPATLIGSTLNIPQYSAGGGGAAWGSITGTLSAQTDLATALAGKQASITTGTSDQYLNGVLGLGSWVNCVAAGGVLQYSTTSHALTCHTLASADIPNNAANTSGTAAGLAAYPTLCSGGQFSQGLSSGSNNCGTPSGGGGSITPYLAYLFPGQPGYTGSGSTSYASTANGGVKSLFTVSVGWSATYIFTYVATGSAGGFAELGIYNQAGTSLLCQAGPFSVATAGAMRVSFASTCALSPGVYLLLTTADNTVAKVENGYAAGWDFSYNSTWGNVIASSGCVSTGTGVSLALNATLGGCSWTATAVTSPYTAVGN